MSATERPEKQNLGLKAVDAVRDLLAPPDWLRQITWRSLSADLGAGLTGAAIVLPQGVAFAAIAGLPPQYGFYTAMVPPVVAALFGSSWHTVAGPTTAQSALVFAALIGAQMPGSPAYISIAIALAFIVGVIQLVLGLARLGILVDFVSPSVMTGFVSGTSILIIMSQLDYVFGTDLPKPDDLLELVRVLPERVSGANPYALSVAVAVVVAGVLAKRLTPKLPTYLIALTVGAVLGAVWSSMGKPINLIGEVSGAAPHFKLPEINLQIVKNYSSTAFALAIVGLLQALSVARAIALRSGQPIDGNREIIGQGLSNLIGSLFQCYPSSGSLTRSGINFEAGARSPLSAVFAALSLFLILQFVAPWFAYVPDAAMGGVILLVAWRLIDFREFRHILTRSISESTIALATLLATLFIDLEFSVYIGVFLSFLFFIRNSSRPMIGIGAPDPATSNRMFRNAIANNLAECPQLIVTRLDGPLFFGSVETVRRKFRWIERARPEQKHMLFIVKGVGDIDLPAADLLIEEANRRQRNGGSFHLMTRTPKTLTRLARFKVMTALTKRRIHLSKGDAIAEIVTTLDPAICATCTKRIFRECALRPAPEAASEDGEWN